MANFVASLADRILPEFLKDGAPSLDKTALRAALLATFAALPSGLRSVLTRNIDLHTDALWVEYTERRATQTQDVTAPVAARLLKGKSVDKAVASLESSELRRLLLDSSLDAHTVPAAAALEAQGSAGERLAFLFNLWSTSRSKSQQAFSLMEAIVRPLLSLEVEKGDATLRGLHATLRSTVVLLLARRAAQQPLPPAAEIAVVAAAYLRTLLSELERIKVKTERRDAASQAYTTVTLLAKSSAALRDVLVHLFGHGVAALPTTRSGLRLLWALHSRAIERGTRDAGASHDAFLRHAVIVRQAVALADGAKDGVLENDATAATLERGLSAVAVPKGLTEFLTGSTTHVGEAWFNAKSERGLATQLLSHGTLADLKVLLHKVVAGDSSESSDDEAAEADDGGFVIDSIGDKNTRESLVRLQREARAAENVDGAMAAEEDKLHRELSELFGGLEPVEAPPKKKGGRSKKGARDAACSEDSEADGATHAHGAAAAIALPSPGEHSEDAEESEAEAPSVPAKRSAVSSGDGSADAKPPRKRGRRAGDTDVATTAVAPLPTRRSARRAASSEDESASVDVTARRNGRGGASEDDEEGASEVARKASRGRKGARLPAVSEEEQGPVMNEAAVAPTKKKGGKKGGRAVKEAVVEELDVVPAHDAQTAPKKGGKRARATKSAAVAVDPEEADAGVAEPEPVARRGRRANAVPVQSGDHTQDAFEAEGDAEPSVRRGGRKRGASVEESDKEAPSTPARKRRRGPDPDAHTPLTRAQAHHNTRLYTSRHHAAS